ncbi:hypothetical protein FRX31_026769, partial [Thalictrum thalictroides]
EYGYYASVLVDIDLAQAIPDQILVEVEGQGLEFWQEIQLGKTPKFCNHCKVVGHLVSDCRILKKKIEEQGKIDKAKGVVVEPTKSLSKGQKKRQKRNKKAADNKGETVAQPNATATREDNNTVQQEKGEGSNTSPIDVDNNTVVEVDVQGKDTPLKTQNAQCSDSENGDSTTIEVEDSIEGQSPHIVPNSQESSQWIVGCSARVVEDSLPEESPLQVPTSIEEGDAMVVKDPDRGKFPLIVSQSSDNHSTRVVDASPIGKSPSTVPSTAVEEEDPRVRKSPPMILAMQKPAPKTGPEKEAENLLRSFWTDLTDQGKETPAEEPWQTQKRKSNRKGTGNPNTSTRLKDLVCRNNPVILGIAEPKIAPSSDAVQKLGLVNFDKSFLHNSSSIRRGNVWVLWKLGAPIFRIQQKLRRLKQVLKTWNREVFGDLDEKIKSAEQELFDWEELAENDNDNDHTDWVVDQKRKELEQLLMQKEVYWQQKSGAQWMNFGERSTAYFHGLYKLKTSQKMILELRNEEGTYITEQEQLKQHIVDYFTAKFAGTEVVQDADIIDMSIQHRLGLSDKDLKGCRHKLGDLAINGEWAIGPYMTIMLQLAGINQMPSFHDREDRLVWKHDNNGHFSVAGSFDLFRVKGAEPEWAKAVWLKAMHPRLSGMAWKICHGQVPVDSVLQKHGITIASRCYLCHNYEDSIAHLIWDCDTSRDIWSWLSSLFLFSSDFGNLQEAMQKCYRSSSLVKDVWKVSVMASMVEIWKSRNDVAFNDLGYNANKVWLAKVTSNRSVSAALSKGTNWASDGSVMNNLNLPLKLPKAPTVSAFSDFNKD